MELHEKLGVFYLGRLFDPASGTTGDDLLLYDSQDLVTHAVCVGMTGSGKTGLGISILEEAAIDGIPALVIDPKGDLGNLLLTFPDLKPSDFLPWIDPDEARNRGLSPEEYAGQQAALWKRGLSEWGQDGDRIRRLRESADFAVYTPGSDAGLPVSVLSSFAAPPAEVAGDRDLLRDRISTTASGLLSLLGITADPVRSPQHILVSNILDHAWKRGKNLDLGALIRQIQDPPFSRVGVMDLESFYPRKERFELAVTLNNLLAAPGFGAWLEGDPLDVQALLYTPEGRPRVSIFSIAHLGDSERMFFVSMLLNEVLTWMRSRPGTSSLRALLYMDEIFGYMPPVAEPPSKRLLLTLLKQARAYGLGLVLATQNPVDLDYKGLSNTGTWFLGRLQTERDRRRVLDGLQGAAAGAAGFDRGRIAELLSGLGKRVFLLHNVHDEAPVLFQTRWAMSYLRGPLTRRQIARLMDPRKKKRAPSEARPAPVPAPEEPRPAAAETPAQTAPPMLPPGIPQVFLPPDERPDPETTAYLPRILGIARVHCVLTRKQLKETLKTALLHGIPDPLAGPDWTKAAEISADPGVLGEDPEPGIPFADLPPAAGKKSSYRSWKRSFSEHLYRTCRVVRWRSPSLGEISRPGESERDFRVRLVDRAREERDRVKERLRRKYQSRFQTLRERLQRARAAYDREVQQAGQQKVQTVISVGAALLDTLLSRRRSIPVRSGKTAARDLGRISKESGDIRRAREKVETVRKRIQELEEELKSELEQVDRLYDPAREEFEKIVLKPRRTDIDVRFFGLAWVPTASSKT